MITKISSYDLLRVKPKRGNIYYVTDRRSLYKDFTELINHRQVMPAMILNTENERLTKVRPTQGVNYYVIESNNLWIFDTKWILRDGNKVYNTYNYSSSSPISPVHLESEEITNTEGDKIIDNNGLLGNGTVVVRDITRIQRATLTANDAKKVVEITSFLENGIIFRPFGLGPSVASMNNVGSLQLGVNTEVWGPDGFERANYTGAATYKGDFTVEGDLIISKATNNPAITIFSLPEVDETVEFEINCTKSDPLDEESEESEVVTTRHFFTIIPQSETTAKVRLMSYTAENPELSPSGDEILVYKDGWEIDAIRTVNGEASVTYELLGINYKITLTPPVGMTYFEPETIGVTLQDTTYSDNIEVKATLVYRKSISISSLLETGSSNAAMAQKITQLEAQLQSQQSEIAAIRAQLASVSTVEYLSQTEVNT